MNGDEARAAGAAAPGQSRFEELRDAVRGYGDAAFRNLIRCRAFARAIIDGFAAFEGCPPGQVVAVPAVGAFDPRKEYKDEAFSYHSRPVVLLEPVRFGLCLIVGDLEDQGALWLRTQISIEMSAEGFDVYVAARPRIRAPLEFGVALERIFEEVHAEFLETFTRELNDFNDVSFSSRIGFAPV
ncbi:MAG: hypothetical protein GC152_11035 [Alphaproteobacteria bacterium]|nr:hypothetical protein [Alphaproteobacteria bacterium]